MSFRGACYALLFFIFLEIFLTAIRPTWTDGGDIAHYILVGIHVLVVLLEAIMVFVLFSSTIWFAAGLLGQLLFAVAPTLPFWVLRFVVCWLPWVYKRFVEDGEDTPWSYGAYVFLVILDVVSCICLSVSLCYTLCAVSDKRMYIPYHTAIGQGEREAASNINASGVVGDRHGAGAAALALRYGVDGGATPSGFGGGGGGQSPPPDFGATMNGGVNNLTFAANAFANNGSFGDTWNGRPTDAFEMTVTGGGNAAVANSGNSNGNGRVHFQQQSGPNAGSGHHYPQSHSNQHSSHHGAAINNDSFAGPPPFADRGGGGLPPLSGLGSRRLSSTGILNSAR